MRDWLKVFNKDQFLFIVTEHYSRDIPNTLIKVFEFLNLGKYCISSVAIQLSMRFKWQSTVLSTILPLFMCITKNNTCTMYINCCTCSQPKYAWNISCWTLSKQSEKIHTDGPACVWFKKSNPIFTLFVQSKMNGVGVLVLNATFSNISVIPLWSVVLVDETWGSGENHRPATRQWQAERINRHRNNDWHKGRRDKCSVR